MLQIDQLSCLYGPIIATTGISLHVDEGEIVTLIGANGAGKSSTVGAISGTVEHTGTILFDGKPLPKSMAAIVKSGIVQVPEGRLVFPELTVQENLQMGAYSRKDRGSIAKIMRECFDMFPVLAERRGDLAGNLSGGQQQMLVIGRAIMAKPRLLMLDEPSLGLAPPIVRDLMHHIERMNKELGMTILLIEQSIGVALQLAHRGYVLERGRIVASGQSAELFKMDSIRDAYLGTA